MNADTKILGLILLVIGVVLLIAGVFIGMSSTGLAGNQESGVFNAFTSGSIRLAIGIGIGALGVMFLIVGAFIAIRDK